MNPGTRQALCFRSEILQRIDEVRTLLPEPFQQDALAAALCTILADIVAARPPDQRAEVAAFIATMIRDGAEHLAGLIPPKGPHHERV